MKHPKNAIEKSRTKKFFGLRLKTVKKVVKTHENGQNMPILARWETLKVSRGKIMFHVEHKFNLNFAVIYIFLGYGTRFINCLNSLYSVIDL